MARQQLTMKAIIERLNACYRVIAARFRGTAMEYGLIVALASLVIMIALNSLGFTLTELFGAGEPSGGGAAVTRGIEPPSTNAPRSFF